MFHIHRNSTVPLAEQICREFADRIQTGMLEGGSRLPSVRALSVNLGVSLVTVVQAYQLLERRGLAKRVHGKGTFVRESSFGVIYHGGSEGDAQQPRSTSHTHAVGPYDWQLALTDYLPRATVLHGRSAGSDVPYKMSTAALQPSLTAAEYSAQFHTVMQDASNRLAEYSPVEGLEDLRGEMGTYLHEQGWVVKPEEILITNGVQQAIDVVARTFVGPGDIVVVEAPTYSGAIDVFRSRGAILVSIPVDDEGMRMDLLMRQCDLAPPKLIYTMPTFHNPTGVVMSAKRRSQLLDIAESYHALIFEDDSFSDCTFRASVPLPIRSLDKGGHVIYAKGFSKVFCPGCRIAAVVSSGSVRNRLVAAKSVSDLGSPILTQVMMKMVLSQPNRKHRIEHVIQQVQRKRDIALRTLEAYAPDGVDWTKPLGGFNIWITLPTHVSTDDLLVLALAQGVSFLPGSACYATETVRHQFRLSFAFLSDELLREGLIRLCMLLSEVLSSRNGSYLPIV